MQSKKPIWFSHPDRQQLDAFANRRFVHNFPTDVPAGTEVIVTFGGVDKQLLNENGLGFEPAARQAKQQRLPRSTQIQFEFDLKIKPVRLVVDMDGAEAYIFGQVDSPIVLTPEILVPKRSTLTTFYSRKGKNKVLHAYHQGRGHPALDIHLALKRYSEFFCIDTNCWRVEGLGIVAATTAIHSTARIVTKGACFVASDMYYQDISINPTGNPELHGIWTFLNDLRARLPSPMTGKVALVTDTEYSKVMDWNDRTEPFFEGSQ